MRRGQALVEAAICLPLVTLLLLWTAAAVRVADARAGLDAATAAAAAAAARAPHQSRAAARAGGAFSAVSAHYPLERPALTLSTAFARGGLVSATGTATVDLSFAPLPGLARHLPLTKTVLARVEDWRSRS